MKRSAVTPSLYVPDVAAAVRFYKDILGFSQTGSWEEGGALIWAEVALSEARVWFFSSTIEDKPGPAFSGLLYLFVEDVDAIAAMLRGKVAIRWGPEDQPYGLRELGIEDLNGYLLVFAKDIA